jgi:hypothetical protein
LTSSKEKNRIKSDRIEVKGEVQEAMDKAAADTAANGADTEDDMEDDSKLINDYLAQLSLVSSRGYWRGNFLCEPT